MDRVIEFWYTFSLHVGTQKVVRHAAVGPSNPTSVDVTNSFTSIDALLRILRAGYNLHDRALINAALASARHLIVHIGIEAMECVRLLENAYTSEAFSEEHELVMKRLLLATALRMRSSFKFPGAVQVALTKVLQCEELRVRSAHCEGVCCEGFFPRYLGALEQSTCSVHRRPTTLLGWIKRYHCWSSIRRTTPFPALRSCC